MIILVKRTRLVRRNEHGIDGNFKIYVVDLYKYIHYFGMVLTLFVNMNLDTTENDCFTLSSTEVLTFESYIPYQSFSFLIDYAQSSHPLHRHFSIKKYKKPF